MRTTQGIMRCLIMREEVGHKLYTNSWDLRFRLLQALTVFWDVTLHTLVERNKPFGESCCLELQGRGEFCTLEMVSPKGSTKLFNATSSNKTVIFTWTTYSPLHII
jgi:hypothetical protein